MDNSELEQNLLSEKDDAENSEKDDYEEAFLTWNLRKYGYLFRHRNGFRDFVHSQGQKLLVASLAFVNIILLLYILIMRNHNECYNQSSIGITLIPIHFALQFLAGANYVFEVGLVPNAFERTMSILTPYATPHENNTARDQLWDDIAVDRGAVAVDEKTVAEYGLPNSMVFPWDSTKQVYIVNAFHQLHCLVYCVSVHR